MTAPLVFRRDLSPALPLAAPILVLASLHVYGVAVWEVGSVSVAIWDFAVVVLALAWLAVASIREVRFPPGALLATTLALVFTMWVGVSALRSGEPERAFTLVIQQMRSFVLFVIVATTTMHLAAAERLNRSVLALGIAFATISLGLYLFMARDPEQIRATPSLWNPAIGYIADMGGVIRLKGLARDPNFYSLWLAPSLFIAFALFKRRRIPIGTALVLFAVTLALAASRTFFAAIAASVGSMIAIMALRDKAAAKRLAKVAALAVLAVVAGAIVWSLLGGNIVESFVTRMRLASQSPRLEAWPILLREVPNHAIMGIGPRGAEALLGGMYSHNTYLDLLVELGLVGALLWLAFAAQVTRVAFAKLGSPGILPWLYTWLLLLVMFAAFSLLYNPFPWMIAGLLLAWPSARPRPEKAETSRATVPVDAHGGAA